jgi:hypothetical protein
VAQATVIFLDDDLAAVQQQMGDSFHALRFAKQ